MAYTQECILQLVPAEHNYKGINDIFLIDQPRIIFWRIQTSSEMLKELNSNEACIRKAILNEYKRLYPSVGYLKEPYQPRITRNNSSDFLKIIAELESWITIT